jgi:hypothetical protein
VKKNEGVADRVARVVVGLAVLSLLFWGPRTPFALIGAVPLLTGLVGFCPLYQLVGWKTCPAA